jgi:dihydrofolate reductase
MKRACRITVHMVSSLDGYIAKKDNSVSWFETSDKYEKGIDPPDPSAFEGKVDCYVMGSKTYEHALALSKDYGWVYGDVPTIVLSRRDLTIERDNVSVFPGDLQSLIRERLDPQFRNIWVVGGSDLSKSFLREGLVDEIRVTLLPIILGDGLLFLETSGVENALHLKDANAYKSGVVELVYEIVRQTDQLE